MYSELPIVQHQSYVAKPLHRSHWKGMQTLDRLCLPCCLPLPATSFPLCLPAAVVIQSLQHRSNRGTILRQLRHLSSSFPADLFYQSLFPQSLAFLLDLVSVPIPALQAMTPYLAIRIREGLSSA